MSELQDRIAAVIRREVPCHPPAADRIARAVIRELGNLRQEPHNCGRGDCHRHRIVSDWQGMD